ncbi:MAG: thioesterase domain-containing protein [Tepidisphaeraceae bacterium]
MTPGQLEWVQTGSDRPLAGNVYLIRGFIGIWSYGVDSLGRKINEAGIRASVFQEDQWQQVADTIIAKYRNSPDHEPIVLIGHSYGADDVIRMAKRLGEHNMTVDLVITLDPTTPPQVPRNVKLCYNIYQPGALDALPFFRGVALETESPDQKNLANVNIRAERRDLLDSDTDHFNIEKNEKIHAEVIKKVKEFCPPRSDWVAQSQARRHRSAAGEGIQTGSPASGAGTGSTSSTGVVSSPGPLRASQAGLQ